SPTRRSSDLVVDLLRPVLSTGRHTEVVPVVAQGVPLPVDVPPQRPRPGILAPDDASALERAHPGLRQRPGDLVAAWRTEPGALLAQLVVPLVDGAVHRVLGAGPPVH